MEDSGQHGCRDDAHRSGGDQRRAEPSLPAHDEQVLAGAYRHSAWPGCERHSTLLLGLGKPQCGGGKHLGGVLTRAAAC
eukprot:4247356-Pleurochrysis_carterae.AAC.1